MTIMTMNCMHGHYAGECKSLLCECRCHRPRIGNNAHPNREWEVWDDGARGGGSPRWVIWHPIDLSDVGMNLGELDHFTLQDALDEIAVIEWLHTDRFEQWREPRR